jgi:hypothetical protein
MRSCLLYVTRTAIPLIPVDNTPSAACLSEFTAAQLQLPEPWGALRRPRLQHFPPDDARQLAAQGEGTALKSTTVKTVVQRTVKLTAWSFLCSVRQVPLKYVFVIWFAGLRGAIAFALALSYGGAGGAVGAHNAGLIKGATLFTVLFTTLVLGVATAPLLNWLKLTGKAGGGGAGGHGAGGGGGGGGGGEGLEGSSGIGRGLDAYQPPLLGGGGGEYKEAGGGGAGGGGRGKARSGGIHGRWKKFDEEVMQPMFGRAKVEAGDRADDADAFAWASLPAEEGEGVPLEAVAPKLGGEEGEPVSPRVESNI